MDRNKLYQELEDQLEFMRDEFHRINTADEDLSPTETITVSALERQKANFESARVKQESALEKTIEQINKLDAQIARMKAT